MKDAKREYDKSGFHKRLPSSVTSSPTKSTQSPTKNKFLKSGGKPACFSKVLKTPAKRSDDSKQMNGELIIYLTISTQKII